MNNIELLREFVDGKTGSKLIVNQVSEDIAYFYVNLIEREASSREIILNYQDNLVENINNDLFGNNEIYILFSNNKKNIEKYVNSNIRCIIFTDYKNYKMLSGQYNVVNGYNFEKDIHYYFKDIHGIKNEDLINYCISQPFMIFSEISKYLINEINYSANISVNNTNNFILNFRKDIFSIKKRGLDIKKLFSIIKREAKYKKFNFLTY